MHLHWRKKIIETFLSVKIDNAYAFNCGPYSRSADANARGKRGAGHFHAHLHREYRIYFRVLGKLGCARCVASVAFTLLALRQHSRLLSNWTSVGQPKVPPPLSKFVKMEISAVNDSSLGQSTGKSPTSFIVFSLVNIFAGVVECLSFQFGLRQFDGSIAICLGRYSSFTTIVKQIGRF